MSKRVFSFHYTLSNKAGETLDSSKGQEPFPVLENSGQIIPGLEEVLYTLNVGDKKKIDVAADKAYGQINDELRVKVARKQLPEGDIGIGTQFRGGENPNDPVFRVVKIEGEDYFLDGNHPLAGEDLTFDVEVIEIRDASEEEVTHGHAHGPNGHEH